jgi:hypothetical protein
MNSIAVIVVATLLVVAAGYLGLSSNKTSN